jgi:Sulfotransferase domain
VWRSTGVFGHPHTSPSNTLLVNGEKTLKLALVSTPRSGNTWLRYLLASVYGLEQFAVHTPQSLDWKALPGNSIVQLHWHHTQEFRSVLADNGFEVVSVIRHPLAVLLSIWQFASHEPETASWLNGEGGSENTIINQPVTGRQVLDYACGDRFKSLLAVSVEWRAADPSRAVRYEDLVLNPEATLGNLCQLLGPHSADIRSILDNNRIEKLRPTSQNNHFWRGETDAWKSLIPHEFILQIEGVHADVFSALGYERTASNIVPSKN